MLQKIKKEQPNTSGEKYLNYILEREYFSLWTYPSVYTDEGISKNKIGKELCDSLVFFENNIFMFSEKTISFNPDIDKNIAWSRWKKSAIDKSYSQLVGAKKFLENYPERIFLDKECTHPFPLDLKNKNYKIHLISIATGIYSHCKNYFDRVKFGSSGSLMTHKSNNAKDSPFIINISNYNFFFHVFDDTTFELLIKNLGSISDLSDYIKKREVFFKNQDSILLPGEEELLAIYFDTLDKFGFGNLLDKRIEKNRNIRITEYHWDSFKKTDKYSQIQKDLKYAEHWNYITKNLSDAVCNGVSAENKDAPLDAHEAAIKKLAAENRKSKATLGLALTYKTLTVPNDRRSAIVVPSICNIDTYFTILIYPYEENDGNYEEHRINRLDNMNIYGLVTKFKFPEAKFVIIIGTDSISSPLNSESVLALEYPKYLSREERSIARRVMIEDNILKNVKVIAQHPYKLKRKDKKNYSDTVIID